jgi:hypothetical protein
MTAPPPPQNRPPFARRITESVTCVLLLLLAETGIAHAKRALRRQYPCGTGLALLAGAPSLAGDAVDLDLCGRR